jgi:DNA-binding response OmpR family regulator
MKNGQYVILYIDDDQDMLDSIRMILENNNFIMEEAPTAEDGIKKYKDIDPDLIIVDLMMEEVDSGTNFVKELKALGNKAPLYMLSSVGDQLNLTADYAELGLAGVFQKPVSPEHLVKTIKRKLDIA